MGIYFTHVVATASPVAPQAFFDLLLGLARAKLIDLEGVRFRSEPPPPDGRENFTAEDHELDLAEMFAAWQRFGEKFRISAGPIAWRCEPLETYFAGPLGAPPPRELFVEYRHLAGAEPDSEAIAFEVPGLPPLDGDSAAVVPTTIRLSFEIGKEPPQEAIDVRKNVFEIRNALAPAGKADWIEFTTYA